MLRFDFFSCRQGCEVQGTLWPCFGDIAHSLWKLMYMTNIVHGQLLAWDSLSSTCNIIDVLTFDHFYAALAYVKCVSRSIISCV